MTDSSARNPGRWRWDIRQDLVELDDAARAVLGEPIDGRVLRFELLCQSIHPDDLPAFRTAMQALVDGRCADLSLDCRIQTRWGQVRQLRLQASVQGRDPGAGVWSITGTLSRSEVPDGGSTAG